MNEVDIYISSFPPDIRKKLTRIRMTILKNAPGAEESLSYRMPSYRSNGKILVYFAAFKNHIGFYATPTGHSEFIKELSGFKQGKGSVQFPLDKPVPYKLIAEIVKFRVIENRENRTRSNRDL